MISPEVLNSDAVASPNAVTLTPRPIETEIPCSDLIQHMSNAITPHPILTIEPKIPRPDLSHHMFRNSTTYHC